MEVRVVISGVRPLLMSNQRSADPNDPIVQEMQALTRKASKATAEERRQISNLEFRLRIYHDAEIGP